MLDERGSSAGPPANNAIGAATHFMQRLEELEERTGDLESQLLNEKKQRLKQEQRQGQLELQLVEANEQRMKQDKVIRKLRRELVKLKNKAEGKEDANEDGDESASSAEVVL